MQGIHTYTIGVNARMIKAEFSDIVKRFIECTLHERKLVNGGLHGSVHNPVISSKLILSKHGTQKKYAVSKVDHKSI